MALGTDGIGAAMFDEFRLGFVRLREDDDTETPETAWGWLINSARLFPEVVDDSVTWTYPSIDPWCLAYTTDIRAVDVTVGGEKVLIDGRATRVDADEIRARAGEQAARLFARL